MGSGEIGAKEKSIIDRCTANIYREYIKDYKGDPPTLKDLHKDLMMQKEPAAHDIALALELFTTGSLNIFSTRPLSTPTTAFSASIFRTWAKT